MVKGLYTAYTGMINEQNRMDVLSNNMANVTTVGFKKEGSTSQSFDEVLDLKIKDSTVGYNLATREGYNSRGVKIGENYTDWSQGSFRITGNTYDIAIGGDGFFAIEFTNKNGVTSTKYSRAGEFQLDSNGTIVTHEGDYLLDVNGKHITIDPLKETTIDRAGRVMQDGNVIATIQLQDFENYDYLKKYGETYWEPIEGAQFKKASGQLYSGYLEASNVQTVTEMVNLITISRQYESNQKIIQTIDSTLEKAVNQVGKV